MNPRSSSYAWQTFLDTPPEEHDYESASFVVIPVPYDATTSFRTGSRYGPAAIIDASRHLEDFDVELRCDPSESGIYTLPEITPDASGPAQVVEQVREVVADTLKYAKTPVLIGGEHTLALGAVKACSDWYEDLSVLYLDAHADLRNSYMGTEWGHASVARRISEICPIVEVGVRSLSEEEFDFAQSEPGVEVHFWPTDQDGQGLYDSVRSQLSPNVYLSIDLDVLDPSIMSAVGTPEPGGMSWWDTIRLIREVSRKSRIVGFDVLELSPEEGPVACSSTAARLTYKVMGYVLTA